MPFLLPFPGLEGVAVPASHAIALAGTRLVAPFVHSAALTALPSEDAPNGTVCRKRKRSGKNVSDGVSCALAGAAGLAAIMQLQAPRRMTLQGVYDLVQACDVLLADKVISYLPSYVAPAVESAPLPEVRVTFLCEQLVESFSILALPCELAVSAPLALVTSLMVSVLLLDRRRFCYARHG